jgi:hypothetical protein
LAAGDEPASHARAYLGQVNRADFALLCKVLDNEKPQRILRVFALPRKRSPPTEAAQTARSQNLGDSSRGPFRQVVTGALRFWEPGRLLYNFVLAAVVIIWIVATWPHFRPAFALSSLLPLAALALIANVCYCAAYLVDIPMQLSPLSAVWRRRRWALWLAGMLIAILLANYWIADEIYPFVH